MKFRADFVTNSSSSSYVLMLKEEDYDALLPDIDEDMAYILNDLRDGPIDIFGVKVITFTTWNTHSYSWGEGLGSDAYEQWERFEELLKEKKIETRSITSDF